MITATSVAAVCLQQMTDVADQSDESIQWSVKQNVIPFLFSQLHVMDETHVINQVKEDVCYVSQQFYKDMEIAQ